MAVNMWAHVFDNIAGTCSYCGVHFENHDGLNTTCEERRNRGLGKIAEIVADDIAKSSGLIVFRVKLTWANSGRLGETDEVVFAKDAAEAIRIVWEGEDPVDLRTVDVEWLCPVECIGDESGIIPKCEAPY